MKAVILAEMAVIVAGHELILLKSGTPFLDTAIGDLPRLSLAVVLVLAVLLTMDDLGAGKLAALFGGLMATSYLLASGGVLGPAAKTFVNEYVSGKEREQE